MPVKVFANAEQLPYRPKRKSIIGSLPEFQDVRKKLTVGLRPHEVLAVELPASKDKGRKHTRITFVRHVRSLLKQLGLTGYNVTSLRDGTTDVVLIEHQGKAQRGALAGGKTVYESAAFKAATKGHHRPAATR